MSVSTDKAWYDQIPSLRRSLLVLRQMPPDQRELIARQVMQYAKSLQLTEGSQEGNVGYDKVVAMMQTKQQAQEFANDPYLIKALNETYDLNAEGRHQVGLKMLLCVQAIDQYEKTPGHAPLIGSRARIVLHNLIQKVFEHDIRQFEAQGQKKRQEREEARQVPDLPLEEEVTAEALETDVPADALPGDDVLPSEAAAETAIATEDHGESSLLTETTDLPTTPLDPVDEVSVSAPSEAEGNEAFLDATKSLSTEASAAVSTPDKQRRIQVMVVAGDLRLQFVWF